MATVITEECINCGACEPECPNTAIYQGGVEYDWQGSKHAALSNDFFYIVPEKCTECVGFFDHEACAAVCPVDCCVPDPKRPETHDALLQRARELHPDKAFGADAPSRFHKGNGAAPAGDGAPAAAVAAPSAAAPAAAAKPAAAAPAAPAAKPAAAAPAAAPAAKAAAAPAAAARVEKPLRPPARTLAAGDPGKDFEGELREPFSLLLDRLQKGPRRRVPALLGLPILLASPLLGALGHKAKRDLEAAIGDRRYFNAEMATGLNILLNFLLYPIAFTVIAFLGGSVTPFTEDDKGWIILGLLIAMAEAGWRLRDGFRGMPASDMRFGPAIYGAPLSILVAPIASRFSSSRQSGGAGTEGFYTTEFDEKRERERRYGEVYRVDQYPAGYYVRFELPRKVPRSGAKHDLGIGDEMPDYDVKLSLDDHTLTVRGRVVDESLRALCGVSSSFPADFKTPIPLEGRLAGFRHRYADKVLEVVVLRQDAS
ncbi:MAG TPA: 4Fe-4S dicluster domain-containing protein [Candidatus Limnocylindrales bacterium]|nr:4Fe-4S dicluster domain-containing protein [Candidatus Limnocylindrales bacterium]